VDANNVITHIMGGGISGSGCDAVPSKTITSFLISSAVSGMMQLSKFTRTSSAWLLFCNTHCSCDNTYSYQLDAAWTRMRQMRREHGLMNSSQQQKYESN
jgi:hypothetical protein